MILFRAILLCILLSPFPLSGAFGSDEKSDESDESDEKTVKWQLDGLIVNLPAELQTATIQDTSLSKHRAFVLETLVSQGYFNAQIDSISLDEKNNASIIHSVRGCRFSVGELNVNSTPSEITGRDDLLDSFKQILYPGNHFSSTLLQNEIERYLKHFEARGYILVRIQVDTLEPLENECIVNIGLSVKSGPRLKVSGQILPPLKRNNPEFIKRASGVRESMIMTPLLLRNARLNLENTGLFESVENPEIVNRDSLYYLMYDLEESRVNAFDLLLGYVPKPQGGNTVVGTGNLMIRNALLDGSRLSLAFERLQQLVTKLNVRYDTHWIAGYPIGAGVHFNFLQQDSTYQVRNFGLNGRFGLSATTEILGTLRQESSSSNASQGTNLTVFDANALFAGVGIEYRQTDSQRNPTSGFETRILFETGVKRFNDERLEEFTNIKRLNQQEINLQARAYLNPFRRQVISPSLSGYAKISKLFTESDLNRFGGANTFRGYREDQFQSSKMIWGDVEYRYLLDQNSHAFVFGALGYFERPRLINQPEGLGRVNEWLRSYGLGFQYDTPLGIMKFTYAISKEDTFGNGKVHVGIQSRF